MREIKTEEEMFSSNGDDDQWLRQWAEPDDFKDVSKVKLSEELKQEVVNEDIERDLETPSINRVHLPTSTREPHFISCKEEETRHLGADKESAKVNEFRSKQKRRCNNQNDTKTADRMSAVKRRHYIDKLIGDLCQHAPESEMVANMCVLQCPECNESIKGWYVLRRHYRIRHRSKHFKMTQVKDIVSMPVCHTCKICSEKVLCDTRFMERHLHQHNLNISQYAKELGVKVQTPNSTDKAHTVDKIARLCRDAPVSKEVSNKCKFQCPTCHESLTGWNALYCHISKKHKTKKPGLVKIDELTLLSVRHICQICSENVLCDTYFMSRHLKKHNMNISQYRKKFNTSTKNLSGDVIGNLCVYECPECGVKMADKGNFSQHQKKHVYVKSSEANRNLIKKVYHRCKLCDRQILCTLHYVQVHLKASHNICLEEYCKKTGCTISKRSKSFSSSFIKTLKISRKMLNLCLYSCNLCSETFVSFSTFRKHMADHGETPLKHLSTYLVKGSSYQCEKCHKLILCDIGVIHKHLKQVHNLSNMAVGSASNMSTRLAQYRSFCDDFIKGTPVSMTKWSKSSLPLNSIDMREVSSSLGNLCRFKCQKCDSYEFSNWLAIVRHHKKIHNCSISYSPTLLSVARCHQCLICPTGILSDRSFLIMHLSTYHKMKLTKYERIFREHGGKILPSFRVWMKAEDNKLYEEIVSYTDGQGK